MKVAMHPIITPRDVKCSWPLSCATGINSSSVMNTITPPAKAKPKGTRLWKIPNKSDATKAPSGSIRPETKANLSASSLEEPFHAAAEKGVIGKPTVQEKAYRTMSNSFLKGGKEIDVT